MFNGYQSSRHHVSDTLQRKLLTRKLISETKMFTVMFSSKTAIINMN